MMKYLIYLVSIFAMSGVRAECINATYTVTYDCGMGTVADGRTLPDATTVTYGARFTPTGLAGICNPPAGYSMRYGIQISDGNNIAFGNASGFYYYWPHDIVITPSYWKLPDNITPADMMRLINFNGIYNGKQNYTTNDNRWIANNEYGVIGGISACTTVAPLNTASGVYTDYIAPDQDTISNVGGRWCWCKMTSPDIGGLWFFNHDYSTANQCASSCTNSCGLRAAHNNANARRWRIAMFAGPAPAQ